MKQRKHMRGWCGRYNVNAKNVDVIRADRRAKIVGEVADIMR